MRSIASEPPRGDLRDPSASGKQSADRMGEPIGEAFRAMVEQVKQHFGKNDLAFSQWLTLKLIGSGRIARISDVNRELGLQGAAATRLIDRLERRGFLIRKRSRSDRRVVNIIATEAGEAMVEAMQPRLWAFLEDPGIDHPTGRP